MSRPRAARRPSPFQISYEPGINVVLVSSNSDVGLVNVVMENLSTGTIYTYSFHSSDLAILPISGEEGPWRATFYCSRTTYSVLMNCD